MPVTHQDQVYTSGGGGSDVIIDKALKEFQENAHVPDCMVWKDMKGKPELYRYVREYDPHARKEVIKKEPYHPKPFNRPPELGKSRQFVPEEERTEFNFKPKKMEPGVADSMIWWPTAQNVVTRLYEKSAGRNQPGVWKDKPSDVHQNNHHDNNHHGDNHHEDHHHGHHGDHHHGEHQHGDHHHGDDHHDDHHHGNHHHENHHHDNHHHDDHQHGDQHHGDHHDHGKDCHAKCQGTGAHGSATGGHGACTVAPEDRRCWSRHHDKGQYSRSSSSSSSRSSSSSSSEPHHKSGHPARHQSGHHSRHHSGDMNGHHTGHQNRHQSGHHTGPKSGHRPTNMTDLMNHTYMREKEARDAARLQERQRSASAVGKTRRTIRDTKSNILRSEFIANMTPKEIHYYVDDDSDYAGRMSSGESRRGRRAREEEGGRGHHHHRHSRSGV